MFLRLPTGQMGNSEVGHTAVREAVEVLDREVGRVLDAAAEHKVSVVLTADRGNCDEMVEPITGQPQTQHSLYPVPGLIIDKKVGDCAPAVA